MINVDFRSLADNGRIAGYRMWHYEREAETTRGLINAALRRFRDQKQKSLETTVRRVIRDELRHVG